MIQEFILYLKASGYDVRESGKCWVVWNGPNDDCHGLDIITDTEEEQPEVREFCEQELVRLGASGFNYELADDDRWLIDVRSMGLARFGKTKTAASISAVCSMKAQEGGAWLSNC